MLRMCQHTLVPGLFQTEGYAGEILGIRPETTEQDVKEQVEARMSRQAILFREDPPRLACGRCSMSTCSAGTSATPL